MMEWIYIGKGPTPTQFAQLVRDVGADRVMLGTDFPWWSPAHCVQGIMDLPILSNSEKEAILGANAARILGMPLNPFTRWYLCASLGRWISLYTLAARWRPRRPNFEGAQRRPRRTTGVS